MQRERERDRVPAIRSLTRPPGGGARPAAHGQGHKGWGGWVGGRGRVSGWKIRFAGTWVCVCVHKLATRCSHFFFLSSSSPSSQRYASLNLHAAGPDQHPADQHTSDLPPWWPAWGGCGGQGGCRPIRCEETGGGPLFFLLPNPLTPLPLTISFQNRGRPGRNRPGRRPGRHPAGYRLRRLHRGRGSHHAGQPGGGDARAAGAARHGRRGGCRGGGSCPGQRRRGWHGSRLGLRRGILGRPSRPVRQAGAGRAGRPPGMARAESLARLHGVGVLFGGRRLRAGAGGGLRVRVRERETMGCWGLRVCV